MPTFDTNGCFRFRPSPALALLCSALITACVADEPGLSAPAAGGSAGASGGPAKAGAAGAATTGGSVGDEPSAGVGGVAGDEAQTGGSPVGGQPNGGEPGVEGGSGGEGDGGVHIGPACPFHTDAPGSEGGAGGAESASVTLQVSPFVGNYLADGAGRALYTWGGDLPGDCETPPESRCTADCLLSWPAFDAGARVLPDTLSDAGFGSIQRGDGSYQATYLGWPLYYYKSDLLLGQLTGQGKGKLWHVAEVSPPSVTIMKADALKYLADAAGRTLYVSAADQAGTAESEPISNCVGACLATFEGFRAKNLAPVTSLEPLDFTVFVRHSAGGIQVAYKGMPLYLAATDVKAGDMNGTAVAGFTAALP